MCTPRQSSTTSQTSISFSDLGDHGPKPLSYTPLDSARHRREEHGGENDVEAEEDTYDPHSPLLRTRQVHLLRQDTEQTREGAKLAGDYPLAAAVDDVRNGNDGREPEAIAVAEADVGKRSLSFWAQLEGSARKGGVDALRVLPQVEKKHEEFMSMWERGAVSASASSKTMGPGPSSLAARAAEEMRKAFGLSDGNDEGPVYSPSVDMDEVDAEGEAAYDDGSEKDPEAKDKRKRESSLAARAAEEMRKVFGRSDEDEDDEGPVYTSSVGIDYFEEEHDWDASSEPGDDVRYGDEVDVELFRSAEHPAISKPSISRPPPIPTTPHAPNRPSIQIPPETPTFLITPASPLNPRLGSLTFPGPAESNTSSEPSPVRNNEITGLSSRLDGQRSRSSRLEAGNCIPGLSVSIEREGQRDMEGDFVDAAGRKRERYFDDHATEAAGMKRQKRSLSKI